MKNYHTYPRLMLGAGSPEEKRITFSDTQVHYLRNVMRIKDGERIRVFYPDDHEYLATCHYAGKNMFAEREYKIRDNPKSAARVHLVFPPLAKDRLDFLIEKGVELGVTDFHPVITERTDIKRLNTERIISQIVEAVEQSERFSRPQLHGLLPLSQMLSNWPRATILYAALERQDGKNIDQFFDFPPSAAFLVGPPGGFTEQEMSYLLQLEFVKPVSLGPYILRTETACLSLLSRMRTSFISETGQ